MGERRSDSATAAAATRHVSRGPVQPGCALEVQWIWTPSRRPRCLAWSRAKCIGVPVRDCVSGNRCSSRAAPFLRSGPTAHCMLCRAAGPVVDRRDRSRPRTTRAPVRPGRRSARVDGTSAEINLSAWGFTLLRGGPPSARLAFRKPVGAVPGPACSPAGIGRCGIRSRPGWKALLGPVMSSPMRRR